MNEREECVPDCGHFSVKRNDVNETRDEYADEEHAKLKILM